MPNILAPNFSPYELVEAVRDYHTGMARSAFQQFVLRNFLAHQDFTNPKHTSALRDLLEQAPGLFNQMVDLARQRKEFEDSRRETLVETMLSILKEAPRKMADLADPKPMAEKPRIEIGFLFGISEPAGDWFYRPCMENFPYFRFSVAMNEIHLQEGEKPHFEPGPIKTDKEKNIGTFGKNLNEELGVRYGLRYLNGGEAIEIIDRSRHLIAQKRGTGFNKTI